MENAPGLKMYFLVTMGIFQPAMLGYQMVKFSHWPSKLRKLMVKNQVKGSGRCGSTDLSSNTQNMPKDLLGGYLEKLTNMGVSKNRETPQNGWLVMENPI